MGVVSVSATAPSGVRPVTENWVPSDSSSALCRSAGSAPDRDDSASSRNLTMTDWIDSLAAWAGIAMAAATNRASPHNSRRSAVKRRRRAAAAMFMVYVFLGRTIAGWTAALGSRLRRSAGAGNRSFGKGPGESYAAHRKAAHSVPDSLLAQYDNRMIGGTTGGARPPVSSLVRHARGSAESGHSRATGRAGRGGSKGCSRRAPVA